MTTHMTRDAGAAVGQPQLLPREFLCETAECLRLMAHPVRLAIADLLSQGDLPVFEIAQRLDLPPNQACDHLRRMQRVGLLASRRRGRTVCYRIAAAQVNHLLGCIRKNRSCSGKKTG
ncbi:MAG: metalloregulator ArsR/SmtB family transcription factor [Planctomycetaceae bacterium]|nr:metalloregulator ArsR/SmtB family transcription factor [Planctomycetaceae bacterium]